MIDERDRFRGCLLGLAVGDALGTTLEFTARDSVDPIVDMVGGGPFDLKAGEWTDDTSMALCLATSLVERKGFIRDTGAAMVGDPARCIELAKRYEAAGCDLLFCLLNPYKLTHAQVMSSIELLGKHVIPALDRGA
jgi:alkanesulfonate monooxygenase SsuD/methylene tetrahydromethanopterin reductase-like flavin-dependent oxidoreductase (luciferase family)